MDTIAYYSPRLIGERCFILIIICNAGNYLHVTVHINSESSAPLFIILTTHRPGADNNDMRYHAFLVHLLSRLPFHILLLRRARPRAILYILFAIAHYSMIMRRVLFCDEWRIPCPWDLAIVFASRINSSANIHGHTRSFHPAHAYTADVCVPLICHHDIHQSNQLLSQWGADQKKAKVRCFSPQLNFIWSGVTRDFEPREQTANDCTKQFAFSTNARDFEVTQHVVAYISFVIDFTSMASKLENTIKNL